MIVEENQIDMLFSLSSSIHDVIPFGSIPILSEKQSTEYLSQNKDKIYFCPHGTWLNEPNFESTERADKFAIFEKHFDKHEAHRCSIQPRSIKFNPIEKYQPKNCLAAQGVHFEYVVMWMRYPLIERGHQRYRKGMDELIKNIHSHNIPAEDIRVGIQLIEMYQLCNDNNRHRINWIIRKITPWVQVERDPENQKKLYAEGEKNELELILHKIVPSEEYSFEIWEQVTSYKHNNVPVWPKLKPLIDLIDERLEKYSKMKSKLIKVMTKLEYKEYVQRGNVKYSKPEVLLIQAYDEDEKSAITFVIHNSLNEPSQEKLYCKETAECRFMTWFETSSIFKEYINDSVTKFAYCCKTMKDEFPMLLDIEIKEVMEMNWNSTSSPTM